MVFYETRELHKKVALRTRWYQGKYSEIKDAILKVASEMGYEVIDINDTYQEMLLEGTNTISIKISSYGRYEHGVDFSLSSNLPFDFGMGKRVIVKWYDNLGKYCKFKGVSLHP